MEVRTDEVIESVVHSNRKGVREAHLLGMLRNVRV